MPKPKWLTTRAELEEAEGERLRKKAMLDAQLLLMRDQAGALGPEQINQMTLNQGADGLLQFPTKNMAGENIDFKQKRQDPNTPVEVDERMGKLLGLTPGVYTWYEREQALKNKRAEAANVAPGQRQKAGFEQEEKKLGRQNMIEAMKIVTDREKAHRSTALGEFDSEEKIAELRDKWLNEALDSLEKASTVKPPKPVKQKPGKEPPLPSTNGVAEGSYLKKGGVRTHVLKDGTWQPLTK